MQALRLYAGPKARQHIEQHGLRPQDVGTVPAAAGGPKGLILGPLDRFIFGHWLTRSAQPVHLVGASIGAWRMATACLQGTASALERLERDYIAQHIALPSGQKRATAAQISRHFRGNLQAFFGGRIGEVLQHPRYQLHVVASRGRRLLAGDGPWRTPLGYLGAFMANAVHRRALGGWLERVVFSTPAADSGTRPDAMLPFETADLRTRQAPLREDNFMDALQASCSIPFVLQAVSHIPGAPPGAYWDGGITDYHLHLDYGRQPGVVLYPHFQKQVVPGWLDKPWKWRHRASRFLDHMLVLAPDPEWVRRLPNGKLPDRNDFSTYSHDLPGRMQAWNGAVSAAQQLADEFAEWLLRPDLGQVSAL